MVNVAQLVGVDPSYNNVLLVSITVLLMIVISFLFMHGSGRGLGLSSGKKKKGDAILIVGPCGSGKTTLFYRLFDDKFPETVTSMEKNEKTFQVEGMEKKIRVIDFPGHARLRGLLLPLVQEAAGMIFLIDAANSDLKVVREIADLIYDVLSQCIRANCEPKILIACNKNDLSGLASPEKWKEQLEKELDSLKSTRHSLDTEGEDGLDIALGTEGEPFEFESDAGCEVDFCSISVKKGSEAMEPIYDFIQQVF